MLDAYTTKSAAITTATTTYPTGAIAAGGAAVDEVEWFKGMRNRPMVVGVHVPQATGGSPTLDVSVESDTTGAFPSAQLRATMPQIIAAGYYEMAIAGIPEDYIRYKLVSGGTTPNFGTVVVGLRMGGRSERAV